MVVGTPGVYLHPGLRSGMKGTAPPFNKIDAQDVAVFSFVLWITNLPHSCPSSGRGLKATSIFIKVKCCYTQPSHHSWIKEVGVLGSKTIYHTVV